MKPYPFIFSNITRYRITRHVVFWVGWILYYTTYTVISLYKYPIPFSQKVFASLFEVTISTPMDMAYCYAIIYFLLPKFLYKGKYLWLIVLWIVFGFAYVVVFRFYSFQILTHIRTFTGLPQPDTSGSFIWFFFYIFSQINMEGGLAASIKLGKNSFIKQQELDLLTAEKQKIETRFFEGIVQPVFLINAINKIETLAIEKPALVPQAIQKIKNILLYVIYDDGQSSINLDTEIKLLEDYLQLEKLASQGNLNISMHTYLNGNGRNAKIAPSILLPIVENCLKQMASYNPKEKELDIDIKLDANLFNMQVSFNKPLDTSNLMNTDNALYLNVSKRLNLLYMQAHDFKVVIEPEKFIVSLSLNLQAATN